MVQKLTNIVILLMLSGCTVEPTVCGLRPIYPVPEYGGPFSDSNAELVFVDVNSLQPTFRWERFEAGNQTGIDLASVRYDLRIWDVQNGAPVGVAYAREGLAETFHRLETPLRPQTKYFWSVRARFLLDGQTRVTPWARSQYPWRAGPDPWKLPMIPDDNYLRFHTPGL